MKNKNRHAINVTAALKQKNLSLVEERSEPYDNKHFRTFFGEVGFLIFRGAGRQDEKYQKYEFITGRVEWVARPQ